MSSGRRSPGSHVAPYQDLCSAISQGERWTRTETVATHKRKENATDASPLFDFLVELEVTAFSDLLPRLAKVFIGRIFSLHTGRAS